MASSGQTRCCFGPGSCPQWSGSELWGSHFASPSFGGLHQFNRTHDPCTHFRSIREEMEKISISLGRKRSQRTEGETEAGQACSHTSRAGAQCSSFWIWWQLISQSLRCWKSVHVREGGCLLSLYRLERTTAGPGPRRSLEGKMHRLLRLCSGIPGRQGGKGPRQCPRAELPRGWCLRGGGMGGEQRLCWGRTKGKDKDYFKPVLITAPNRDWGWEPQLSQGGC